MLMLILFSLELQLYHRSYCYGYRTSYHGLYRDCRYHDMADVIDFLVLRQNYDIAIRQNFKEGMLRTSGGFILRRN